MPFGAVADVYIINTCTVTARTDYQSRQLIRRAHRANPSALVAVTGCYAQINPGKVSSLPGVLLAAGNAEKARLPELIERIIAGDCPRECMTMVGDITCLKTVSMMPVTRFPDHTRAFLKIQDGCDAFCTYCIVPFARGPSRSVPAAAALEAIKNFSLHGYREVVLTGIHLGHYGLDLTPPARLLDILKTADSGKLAERLRLSSIEALEVTDGLISLMASSETLCHHLHLPLQSGDDKILRLMKRHYDTDFFRTLVKKIRLAVPDVAIGIDVMVGFPGEDDASFERTRQFIEELPVSYLHVFPYSERPGTAAVTLPEKVSEPDKKRRAEELRRIGKNKRQSFAELFVGSKLKVLIEDKSKTRGVMTGFSGNYIPVAVTDSGREMRNQIAEVIGCCYRDGKLYARASE